MRKQVALGVECPTVFLVSLAMQRLNDGDITPSRVERYDILILR